MTYPPKDQLGIPCLCVVGRVNPLCTWSSEADLIHQEERDAARILEEAGILR